MADLKLIRDLQKARKSDFSRVNDICSAFHSSSKFDSSSPNIIPMPIMLGFMMFQMNCEEFGFQLNRVRPSPMALLKGSLNQSESYHSNEMRNQSQFLTSPNFV